MSKHRERSDLNPWELALEARLGKVNGQALPEDPETEKQFPNLFKMLTWFSQGTDYLKEGSSVVISVGIRCYIVRVTDADTGLSKETACERLCEAFQALENAIFDNTKPWRYWRGKEPTLRKRRKDPT